MTDCPYCGQHLQEAMLCPHCDTPFGKVEVGKLAMGQVLHQILEKAQPGAQIDLPGGLFEIDRPMHLRVPLALSGAGIDRTIIRCTKGDQVFSYDAAGKLALAGIGFEWASSSQAAGVAVVYQGEIAITQCRFAGGTAGLALDGEVWGTVQQCIFEHNHDAGLSIGGKATVRVEDCVAKANQLAGIRVASLAHNELLRNISSHNGGSGIEVRQSATPVLQENTCLENVQHGIAVLENARPILLNNQCHTNGMSGICFAGESSGKAGHNLSFANAEHGLLLVDGARPEIEENQLRDNLKNGIYVDGQAIPQILRNQVVGNALAGIVYKARTQGAAIGNRLAGNQSSGIIVSGEARPVLNNNFSEENGWHGIEVERQAQPVVENNICNNNQRAGISLAGNAKVLLQNNICSFNNTGIWVIDAAQPTIRSNKCLQNQEHGIYTQSSTEGLIQNNTCERNKMHGIVVAGHGSLTLNDNTCQQNGSAGIAALDDATVQARGNSCIGNVYGIKIDGQAKGNLQGERVSHNSRSGIVFSGFSRGSVATIDTQNNGGCGVECSGQAVLAIESSEIYNNQRSGIAFCEDASGSATENTCFGNKNNGILIATTAFPIVQSNKCAINTPRDLRDVRPVARRLARANWGQVAKNDLKDGLDKKITYLRGLYGKAEGWISLVVAVVAIFFASNSNLWALLPYPLLWVGVLGENVEALGNQLLAPGSFSVGLAILVVGLALLIAGLAYLSLLFRDALMRAILGPEINYVAIALAGITMVITPFFAGKPYPGGFWENMGTFFVNIFAGIGDFFGNLLLLLFASVAWITAVPWLKLMDYLSGHLPWCNRSRTVNDQPGWKDIDEALVPYWVLAGPLATYLCLTVLNVSPVDSWSAREYLTPDNTGFWGGLFSMALRGVQIALYMWVIFQMPVRLSLPGSLTRAMILGCLVIITEWVLSWVAPTTAVQVAQMLPVLLVTAGLAWPLTYMAEITARRNNEGKTS